MFCCYWNTIVLFGSVLYYIRVNRPVSYFEPSFMEILRLAVRGNLPLCV